MNFKSLFRSLAVLGSVLALVLVSFLFCYTVSETEQVILTQLGKPVGQPVNTAGLEFKLPFIQKVNRIDKRVLEWDGRASEMPTRDKLYIIVDTFGRWRISDPLQFFTRLRGERSALSRLGDIIGSELRNAVARHDLILEKAVEQRRREDTKWRWCVVRPGDGVPSAHRADEARWSRGRWTTSSASRLCAFVVTLQTPFPG